MAAISSIPGNENLLWKKMVAERKSYETGSDELRHAYPQITHGLIARTVWQSRDILVTCRLTDAQLDQVVMSNVAKVCIFNTNLH